MLTLLHGENQELMDYYIEKIQKEHPGSFYRYNLKKDDRQQILETLHSFSLFEEEKLVVLEQAEPFATKNETEFSLQDLQSESDLLSIIACVSGSLSKRKEVKNFLEQNQAQIIECNLFNEQSKRDFIREVIKEKKLDIKGTLLFQLAERLPDNPMQIDKELEKLSLLNSHPGLEEILSVLSTPWQENVFKLCDAFYTRNIQAFLPLYRTFRAQNMDMAAIMALLASQIRFLFQVKTMEEIGLSKNEIAKRMQVKAGRIYYAQKNASRFSALELLESLHALSELEMQVRSGAIREDAGFESAILSLFHG